MFFLAALGACGSSDSTTNSPAAEPSVAAPSEVEPASPFGRWFESNDGGSYRFEERAIVVVAQGQLQRRLTVRGWEPDTAGWYVESALGGSALFRIRPLPTGQYELCERERCQALRSASDPARLDAIAAAPPDEDGGSCARAEACCQIAMPLLGGQCDLDRQLGQRMPATCEAFIRGIRRLFEGRPELAIPASCAP